MAMTQHERDSVYGSINAKVSKWMLGILVGITLAAIGGVFAYTVANSDKIEENSKCVVRVETEANGTRAVLNDFRTEQRQVNTKILDKLDDLKK